MSECNYLQILNYHILFNCVKINLINEIFVHIYNYLLITIIYNIVIHTINIIYLLLLKINEYRVYIIRCNSND